MFGIPKKQSLFGTKAANHNIADLHSRAKKLLADIETHRKKTIDPDGEENIKHWHTIHDMAPHIAKAAEVLHDLHNKLPHKHMDGVHDVLYDAVKRHMDHDEAYHLVTYLARRQERSETPKDDDSGKKKK